jgi:hypothetical protein
MAFRHRASIVGLAALILLASTAFSSSAFSSATLERDATVSVSTDDEALITLADGHPNSGLIEQTNRGTIEIDFRRGGATGATERAEFQFGSTSTPASNHAFRIRNRGPSAKDLEFSFALTGSDGGDAAQNVQFRFYHDVDSDGTIDDTRTTSEEDAGATIPSVAPADTVYVVVTVDASNLGSSTDLSGDLSITAGA